MKTSRAIYLKQALSLMHTPYVWGGRDVNGVDCFGTVALALYLGSASGIDLRKWWTHKAWAELPAVVTPNPGDLCFYGGGQADEVDHVMIVLVPPGDNVLSMGVIFGASGGNSDTKTVADAMKAGASVHVKTSIRYRPDFKGYRSLSPYLDA